jgi:hypothetical protein
MSKQRYGCPLPGGYLVADAMDTCEAMIPAERERFLEKFGEKWCVRCGAEHPCYCAECYDE